MMLRRDRRLARILTDPAAAQASAVRPPARVLVAARRFNAVFPAMGVAALRRPGSVDLGRPREAVEAARVDADAGGALDGHEGGQGGEEECCSSHEFGPSVCSPQTQDQM